MLKKNIHLVLMPGIDGTGIFFRPLLGALPHDTPSSVITYPADETLSLAEYAGFVRGQLPGNDVVLVAESFSGLVALMLLHDLPGNVKGVVFSATFAEPLHHLLISTAVLIPGLPSLIKRLPPPLLSHYLFAPCADRVLEHLLREVLPRLSPGAIKNRAGLIARGYPFPEERFSIPVLYLQASGDRVVPQKAARWFARHFNEFELARFDAPHCLLQTRPGECADRIVRYVDRITRGNTVTTSNEQGGMDMQEKITKGYGI